MTDENFVIESGRLEEYIGDAEDVIIPEGVTEISDCAFCDREDISSITIPNSVTKVDDGAFSECYGLKSIYISNPDQLLWFGDSDTDANPLYGECKLYLNGQLVTDLVVSDNAKYIPSTAFAGYAALNSVTIGNSVTSVGDYAFAECGNLEKAVLSDSVKNICAYSFYRCGKLENLTIGKGLKFVERSAFEFCDKIKSVYYNGDIASWCGIEFDDFANPLRNGADFYIKNAYGEYEPMTELVIPAGVKSIGYQAFQGIQNLSKLTVGNDVKQICTEAFAWTTCKTVTIGDSVEQIGMGAFAGSNIETVILGSGVKNIGSGVFYECFDLETIFYNGTKEEFEKITTNDELARVISEDGIKVYYYSEDASAAEGDFWHFVDGEPTAWN